MLAIKNVTLINGIDDAPIENASVVIDGGKFAEVGAEIEIPAAAAVVDGTGKTIMPALSDAHTHMGGTCTFDHPGAGGRTETYDYTEAREGFLSWGVTTVRTCGDLSNDILSFRDDVRAGKIINSPRIISCGPFIQSENGHPWATVYMKDARIAKEGCIFINEQANIEEEVSNIYKRGADFVKVFYAHLNKMDTENFVPRISKTQLERVVATGHALGLKVAVHVDGPREAEDAIDCGADFIEHLIGANSDDMTVDDAFVEKFKASGAVLDPTMISILRFDATPGYHSVWEALKAGIKKLYDAGVPFAVGCDSLIPFVPAGESLHDELACLVETGIDPMSVIKMATMGNAKLFGMDKTIGSIEPGKAADMIVLGSNPLDNISNTKDIKLVMMDGRVIVDRMLAV
ncbi:MAG: amidohydrolase family protein [Oscillospiraceae bacterium]|nr:amidohydrolase family protein [Oscillospiraceae bacterium]